MTDFGAIATSQVTFTASSRVKSQAIPIIFSNSTESIEKFGVTLDKIILMHTKNKSTPNLSNQERTRLILNPRITNVTIFDDNGELP